MLSRSILFVLFFIALLMALPSQAFTTTSFSSPSSATRRTAAPGRSVQGARYQPKSSSKGRSDLLLLASILKMADDDFYDDEIDTEPVKEGISDSMKARLTAEASSGLDSEKSQTNVILYISVIVVGLIALAGGGILF